VDAVTDGRRVVIAEDSVLLLAGLTKLLESAGFEVAATAADAAGLLAAVERERPTWSSPTCGCRPPTPTRASGPPW
jgi:hypothetical protein